MLSSRLSLSFVDDRYGVPQGNLGQRVEVYPGFFGIDVFIVARPMAMARRICEFDGTFVSLYFYLYIKYLPDELLTDSKF